MKGVGEKRGRQQGIKRNRPKRETGERRKHHPL